MNFDSLASAFSLIFHIIMGENLLEAVVVTIKYTGWPSVIYFVILVITGRYILIQMFLAFVLGAFEASREKINFAHLASKAFISRMAKKKKKTMGPLKSKCNWICIPLWLVSLNEEAKEKLIAALENRLEDKSIKSIPDIKEGRDSEVREKSESEETSRKDSKVAQLGDGPLPSPSPGGNLFKRLQSVKEFTKLKNELKHQATMRRQDTI